jgi:hypothetical protein
VTDCLLTTALDASKMAKRLLAATKTLSSITDAQRKSCVMHKGTVDKLAELEDRINTLIQRDLQATCGSGTSTQGDVNVTVSKTDDWVSEEACKSVVLYLAAAQLLVRHYERPME